jgi:hypothetical protein
MLRVRREGDAIHAAADGQGRATDALTRRDFPFAEPQIKPKRVNEFPIRANANLQPHSTRAAIGHAAIPRRLAPSVVPFKASGIIAVEIQLGRCQELPGRIRFPLFDVVHDLLHFRGV